MYDNDRKTLSFCLQRKWCLCELISNSEISTNCSYHCERQLCVPDSEYSEYDAEAFAYGVGVQKESRLAEKVL